MQIQNEPAPRTEYNLADFILPKSGASSKKEKIEPKPGDRAIAPRPPILVGDTSNKQNSEFSGKYGLPVHSYDLREAVPSGITYGDDMAFPEPVPETIFYDSVDMKPPTTSGPMPKQMPGPAQGVPYGEDFVTPMIPPDLPPVTPAQPPVIPAGGSLESIADLYGKMFPGGGDGNIPAPTEQGPVLLYPVTYERPAAKEKPATNPLIFLVLGGIILVGYFVYKKFSKGR